MFRLVLYGYFRLNWFLGTLACRAFLVVTSSLKGGLANCVLFLVRAYDTTSRLEYHLFSRVPSHPGVSNCVLYTPSWIYPDSSVP
jgi:hypothetical protein